VRPLDVLKCALIALVFFVNSQAQEPPASNIRIIEDQILSMIDVAGQCMWPDSVKAVWLVAESSNHPLNPLVRKQFFLWARAKGFHDIYEGPAEEKPAIPCYTFTYLPLQSKISYVKADHGQRDRVRQITSEVYFSVLEPSRKIVLAERKTATFQDSISHKEIPFIESSALAFSQGEKPKDKLISTLFQPVIVGLTTAGIIYSFYSFRSR